MGPIDYAIIAVVALIIGAAVFYIIRTKRSGQRCVGCPHSKTCSGGCNCPTNDK